MWRVGTFSLLGRCFSPNAVHRRMKFRSMHDTIGAAPPTRQDSWLRRDVIAAIAWLAIGSVCLASPALAAEGQAKGSEAILLVQILLLIFFGGLLGELMLLVGQPAVMGQLLAGLLLGPSVLGALWPQAHDAIFPGTPEQKNMIEGLAQFGILMLLLLAGMETELALVRSNLPRSGVPGEQPRYEVFARCALGAGR